jgi:hypothetical protein
MWIRIVFVARVSRIVKAGKDGCTSGYRQVLLRLSLLVETWRLAICLALVC